jgi:hypothetical protein
MSESENKEDQNSANVSRRKFLSATGTAAAAFTIVPRHVLGGTGYQAPSDMINVAGIGVGAQGGFDIQRIADPDVPIERPVRSNTGQPLTPEQIAEMEARRAAWAARRAERQRQAGQQQQAQQEDQPRKLANIYALCDVDTEFAAHVFAG